MGNIGFLLPILCGGGVVIFWVWKVLMWVWWKPRKLERFLREQGLKGTPRKFLYGDLKDIAILSNKARSKPMELSHNIIPRVLPYVHQTVQTYGPLSFNWFGVTPRVNIVDPDMIRDVLSNKFGHFCKIKSNPLTRLLMQGLVSYEGEKWVKQRRIINPAFHIEKLKLMMPAFNDSCIELISKWENLVSDGSCEIDVWPGLQNLTADVISRTAFGSSFEKGRRIFQLQIEQAELVIQANLSIYFPGFRFFPTKRNKRMKEIDREVRTILGDMIKKREKAVKSGESHNNDLLGLLLDLNAKEIQEHEDSKNVGMTIDEIIEECKLFYFAGQETTSTLLVWTMFLLCMYPEWQRHARDEVLQVFGRNKPDFDGLNHLKIVTMILNEVLRLYPPASLLTRYNYKEMKLGKITLPAGVQLALPILLVHHDREIWGKDAEEFKPERFAQGISKAAKNQLSFLPFGWGPRICIGQNFAMTEAKMALAMILQHFSFKLSPSYAHAPHTIITLRPQHGVQIIFEKL